MLTWVELVASISACRALVLSLQVFVGEESSHGISGLSFNIKLARPALMFNSDAIVALYSGNSEFARCLQTYLLSRDHANLKTAFQQGNGKMIASEDLGRQVLTYGERKPVEDFLKTVEGVTLNDITTATQQSISSPLTMASYGNVVNVPSYYSINRMFHAK